ncbi:PAQR family membrane homeostasis protein TrhA [Rhodothermus profundi]|uniref:Hemolysin III n=1 Tax=Rhodothermus profundi TaxID=633813 RepID=A0A1M6UGX5_9BACT|nr:hemolysin III family protein [Rhodothermus profundi]SHK68474.1 hemolysin III [Rhodothermus profundi]
MEERLNTLTHGIGLLLSLLGTGWLWQSNGSGTLPQRIASMVFGFSLILLYLASTLYHGVRQPACKQRLRVVDHVAIYLLIAGTYTPFLVAYVPMPWRLVLLSVVWTLALSGMIFEGLFTGRFPRLSTAFYVALGWLAVLMLPLLWRHLPPGALELIIAGGLVYTGGVLFYRWHRLPFHHTIWHLFVLAGSALHYVAVLRYGAPGS